MTLNYRFLCLLLAQLSHGSDYSLRIWPPTGTNCYIHDTITISNMLDSATLQYVSRYNISNFYLSVTHARDTTPTALILYRNTPIRTTNRTAYYKLTTVNETTPEVVENNQTFSLEMMRLGYSTLYIALEHVGEDNSTRVLANETYLIGCVRKERLVDKGFNVAITILLILNTFALGCITDLDSIKRAGTQQLQIAVAIATQYFLLPMLAFGLLKLTGVQNELAIGFLFLACVPGGGFGYLMVSIAGNTDRDFSVLLNLLQLLLPIASMPLYVYTIGQMFPNGAGKVVDSLYYLVIWLCALLVPYIAGVIVKRRKQDISDGVLNWLIKPCLLLAFILFVTLGLYINMYAFTVLDTIALVTGALIPCLGFGVGGGLMLAAKQGAHAAKTLAIESTILNSVAVIVAIRFTLPQPDADLASAAAMWILFFSPAPFVLLYLVHRIKNKVLFHFKKKEMEDEQKSTLKSSFAAITHNAIQIGGLNRAADDHQPPSPEMKYENGTESQLLIRHSESFQDNPTAVVNNVSFIINPPASDQDSSESGTSPALT